MDCNLAKAQSDVVGDHKPAAWLDALSFLDLGGDKLGLAAVTGAAVVMIALLAAVASQIDNYYKLMKGRTLITIAHRLSTIRHVDKTIVLKGGVVAEQGTHDELLRLDGVHAELYGTQVQPAAPTGA